MAERQSTAIHRLDELLGEGIPRGTRAHEGIPRGTRAHIVGPPGSGKTVFAMPFL